MNGILNLYKPPGMTSAQAVAFIKRLTKAKVGHAGTLDPEAAGVLPILLGRATRLCDELMAQPKQYLAEIAFGAATNTQDAQGEVVQTGDKYPTFEALQDAARAFVGEVQQLPPQYSALKIGGKAAYQLARAGQTAALVTRTVLFEQIDVIKPTANYGFLMRVRCGKGAYIRTLCHDLGTTLACPAHMRLLLREESGGLHLNQAHTPEAVLSWLQEDGKTDRSLLISPADALPWLPKLSVPQALAFAAINGVALPIEEILGSEQLQDGAKACLYVGGSLLGLYRRESQMLRVAVMLCEPTGDRNTADSTAF